jgi:hypothetical protein
MKTLRISVLSILLASCLSFSLNANVVSADMNTAFLQEIKEYVSTLDVQETESEALLFSQFITKDAEGFIYTIDFVVADDCEIIVLSVELEEEYYRINGYNVDDLKTKALSIAEIQALRELKA